MCDEPDCKQATLPRPHSRAAQEGHCTRRVCLQHGCPTCERWCRRCRIFYDLTDPEQYQTCAHCGPICADCAAFCIHKRCIHCIGGESPPCSCAYCEWCQQISSSASECTACGVNLAFEAKLRARRQRRHKQ